jgi:hypothetical protein
MVMRNRHRGSDPSWTPLEPLRAFKVPSIVYLRRNKTHFDGPSSDSTPCRDSAASYHRRDHAERPSHVHRLWFVHSRRNARVQRVVDAESRESLYTTQGARKARPIVSTPLQVCNGTARCKRRPHSLNGRLDNSRVWYDANRQHPLPRRDEKVYRARTSSRSSHRLRRHARFVAQ